MANMPRRLFPAFLDLDGRAVVVVGSGPVAERKARQLWRCGADVVMVGAEHTPELAEAEADGHVVVEPRGYVAGDLEGAALVVCVDPDPEIARAVAEEARRLNIFATVTAAPEESSLIAPSIVHREPLQIAVSTTGVSPEAAKFVRRRIADELSDAWGPLVTLLGEVRALAAERELTPAAASEAIEAALASDLLGRIAAGEAPDAAAVLAEFAPADADAEPAEIPATEEP
jgi:siroheme synthase-like protein